MKKSTKEYWETQYQDGKTLWNIGYISTPIKEYIDQLTDKNISIFIPGAGNSYEAEYLYENGFSNVFILDIASLPLKNFSNRFPLFPKNHIIEEDFFSHIGQYDLIFEQTFFCSLSPELRNKYVDKMLDLLNPNGKLVGVLFDKDFGNLYPPFGGNKDEYVNLFKNKFQIKTLNTAHNSIKPRRNNELFHIFIAKNGLL